MKKTQKRVPTEVLKSGLVARCTDISGKNRDVLAVVFVDPRFVAPDVYQTLKPKQEN